jgi:xanthine dehydrogenase accessory factor
MRDVVRRLTEALAEGREQIVCQVVETKGSTPQKAGALMVVDPNGGQLGTLGGGCVENEVKQKAIRQIGETGAAIHTFILDHDYAWADGLICGGKMVIVSESFRGPAPLAYFHALQDALENGCGFTEAIAVEPERLASAGLSAPLGGRFLFDAQGNFLASWAAGHAEEQAVRDGVIPLTNRPKPAVRGGIAYLPTLPRIRLIIVGAGHVGQAVSALASQADFDVWIVDDRRHYANAERFPEAQRIIVGPFEETLPSLDVTPNTYALIVTRGHGHDQEALYHLATTSAPYVGLIGSRRKIRLIFENLREQGVPEAALARVTAPVGLAIGSQTVPEIAVSIVAELIARRNLGKSAVAAGDGIGFGANGEAVATISSSGGLR